MRDLLVTGTDTGVGKTVVAAALVAAWRARGVEALGFKPVETGLNPGEAADSEVLAAASGVAEPLALPLLRLQEPLAPALAAERAGVSLDPGAVLERIGALRAAGYRLVVEGAGGLRVPLAWGFDALELARRAGLPALVVARAGLGTLNHIALTVDTLRRHEVPVIAVVLNGQADPPTLAEATNPAVLARLLPGLPCVVLPQLPGHDSLQAARAQAARLSELLELI